VRRWWRGHLIEEEEEEEEECEHMIFTITLDRTRHELPEEVCLKEPQCCEIFDRFCFGCRDIAIMKAHQAYRERLRRLMVVPAPGVDQKESTGWKRHSGVSMEVVDLVSDTDDD
jgi:hypothetical protein